MVAIGSIILTIPLANAFNLRFLDDAPISRFSDEDMEIFDQAVIDTLDHKPDRAETSWKNPASGANGVITPLESSVENGMPCRVFRLNNNAGGLSSNLTLKACKDDTAGWQLAPGP